MGDSLGHVQLFERQGVWEGCYTALLDNCRGGVEVPCRFGVCRVDTTLVHSLRAGGLFFLLVFIAVSSCIVDQHIAV